MLKILFALKTPSKAIMSLLDGHKVDIMLPVNKSIQEVLLKNNYDIILLQDDIDILPSVKDIDPRVEVIFFGNNDVNAIEAIKKGASAYFSFSVNELERLKETIDNISNLVEIKKETAELEKILNVKYTFAGVVAKNPRMLDIFAFIRRIAPYYKVVTITGETGTGKEVIAKAMHSISPVSKHPFIVCNCGAMVENLIESELFGHKKGSFTGAIADKIGLFEAAGEGTIFLDEIGELPLMVQPHLLRVLQDGEFRPVGSHRILKARCRIIAATNKDLSNEVKSGKFREDLFYRLTPLIIYIPPLRERKDDIPLLNRVILDRFNRRTGKKVIGISRPSQTALLSYNWPGNVRELENVLEQAAMLTNESFIGLDDLPLYIKESDKVGRDPASTTSLDEVVKKHIKEALVRCNGNRSKAAELLNISRRALLRKMQKYSLN
jgi:transcriptional regulator with PAS, ATPase and Fis domain